MIIIGSTYFFSTYPDFHPHDLDRVDVLDTNEFSYVKIIRGMGKDDFFFKRKPKEEMIQDCLKQKVPMCVGKFLIPEFNELIGFTIDDLPRLKPQIDNLDEKHKYEEIIYNAYLENGGFYLTKEQRDKAYESYKETRKRKGVNNYGK